MAVAAHKYPGIPHYLPIQQIHSALAGAQPKVSAVFSEDGNSGFVAIVTSGRKKLGFQSGDQTARL